MNTATNQHDACVNDGIHLAMRGDEGMAARDQWVKTYLTAAGATIYRDAVSAYERTGIEETLRRDVHRAVSAGY